jgi:hypothetical protein
MVITRGLVHAGCERLGDLARDSFVALTHRASTIDSRSSCCPAAWGYILKGYRASLEPSQRMTRP